jgi:hypothetical protein
MCVNETFATEVSRTSINVADITAAAMSQGLAAGFQGWAAAVGVPFAIDDLRWFLNFGRPRTPPENSEDSSCYQSRYDH